MIKPGLEVVRKRSGDWRCEDIYAAILSQVSTLHIADKDGEYGGFVVLTPLSTLSGKVLHITAAYSTGTRKVMEYVPEIEQMARNIGAKQITLYSTRNWGKYFPYKHSVYAKEV